MARKWDLYQYVNVGLDNEDEFLTSVNTLKEARNIVEAQIQGSIDQLGKYNEEENPEGAIALSEYQYDVSQSSNESNVFYELPPENITLTVGSTLMVPIANSTDGPYTIKYFVLLNPEYLRPKIINALNGYFIPDLGREVYKYL